MKALKNLLGTVTEGGKIADNLVTTDHEVAKELTRRQEIDLTSSFKLPHIIRPLSFLIITCLQVALSLLVTVLGFINMEDPTNAVLGVMATNSTLVATMAGFYFQSRKNEKIAFRNVKANEDMEKLKLEAEIKHKEMEYKEQARIDRREEKRAARRERKNK